MSKYGMAVAKVASTPFEPRSTFGAGEVLEQEGVDPGMIDVPCRSLVRILMYLAMCTRLDVSMIVSALSRYFHIPKMEHWEAAKRVLRYLKGTVGEGLAYSPSEDIAVWGYRIWVSDCNPNLRKFQSGSEL